MKKTLLALGALALVAAGIAWAEPGPTQTLFSWVKGGLYIGPQATNAAGNKITATFETCGTYDFPVLGGGAGACADSWDFQVDGGRFGDTCEVSTNFGADGGSRLDGQVMLRCFAETNKAFIRACSTASDAGAGSNPTDAGYCVRLFSNR